ncbi:MAG: NIL domain-containing protein [Dehalococcoidia bacterium]|nr:NIL domain-containing protein [Dehalococcoidia bacterium]
MAKRRLKFIFPTELVTEPLLYNLGQDFRVVTNICRADITETQGWVVLEMEGSEEDIEQGLAWVEAKGVGVEALESEV